uniref:Phenylalanyl-tRNA synthetase, alpha subunit n=1 Tax=Mus musculus TaxID=10090 RepID=D6RIJ2_MOUSE
MADNPVLELLLRRLEVADGGLDSAELATQLGVEHQAVVGAVKSLQALGEVIEAELRSTKCWELTTEAPAQRQGGLQQGHVQQVDPSGQECRRRAPGVPSGGQYRG